METKEGCATISDKEGNLLFYTNGLSIYNKVHKKMNPFHQLKGDSSSTSSALIIPLPKKEKQYYVFTIHTDDSFYQDAEGLNYSIVDMELNNGLGGIIPTERNINLLETVSEKLTAYINYERDGYWIITPLYR